MKNFILVITLLTFTTLKLSAQWSTDPNNNLIVGYGQDPHVCSDSAGGCYITYTYETTWYPQKLAVERLDKYGFKPWGINKQILGELPEQWQAEIIEDREGGIIVSYQDHEWIPPSYYNSKVRVQKVDSNGNFLWEQTGVRVSMETINHSGQQLVSDGDGGCVIVWADWDGEFSINRINRLGERVWGDSGIVLAPIGTSLNLVGASDGKYYVQIDTIIFRINQNGGIINQYGTLLWNMVPDPEGGIVLSGTMGNINNLRLVSQRKDSVGNNHWQEPYVEITDSLYINTQVQIQYNNGYYYYGWSGTKNGISRIAQFQALRLDGSKLYPEGSIQVSENTPIGSPYIISSDSGRTIYIWNDATISSTTISQIYDTLGNKLWNENGVVVSYPAIAVETTTDGQGGFITMGPINQFTIVAQQVSGNGNLGEVLPIPVELISFTGVVDKDKIILNWITATEINNYGFEIERQVGNMHYAIGKWMKIGFVAGFGTTTELKTYSFIDENISTGTYEYRLKQIDFDGSFGYSIIVEVAVGIPAEYFLEQNFPNPFNPITTIKYDIIKVQDVKVTIYDILGREVKTLVNEQQQPGSYTIKWDASNVSSGVYFYQLKTKDYINTKKMILLK